MRELFPVAADQVEVAAAYADLPVARDRPAVRLNMISSLDGAATLSGVTAGLAGPADRRVLRILRTQADLVLVGAETVRVEGYGGLTVPLAILSRSCAFDLTAEVFTGGGVRPLIITVPGAPAERLAALRAVAEVVTIGEPTAPAAGDQHGVDLGAALLALGDMGFRNVLSEGGPRLSAQLVEADLLDELCLTISPCLVAGESPRILAGPPFGLVKRFVPHKVCEEDGFLFLRMRPE